MDDNNLDIMDTWRQITPQSRFRIYKDGLIYYILPIQGEDTFKDKSFTSWEDAELAIQEYKLKAI